MRVAHIIIAHKNPMQLLRLVRRLEHPNFDIFIHLDAKVDLADFSCVNKIGNTYFLKGRTNCNWGGNSLLVGIIQSLKQVTSGNTEYSHINLLSGQDYPLRTAEELVKFYKENVGSNFIAYDDSVNSLWWKHAKDRFEKYHLTDLSFRGRYLAQSILNKFFPKRVLPFEGCLYGSERSTWWIITGECGKYLVNELEGNKKLLNFLRYCWGTDEVIPTTLIMNSKFSSTTVNNNMRYIDWSENKQNPKVLTTEDYVMLKQSNVLFARKFDIYVDENILNRIDSELLGIT